MPPEPPDGYESSIEYRENTRKAERLQQVLGLGVVFATIYWLDYPAVLTAIVSSIANAHPVYLGVVAAGMLLSILITVPHEYVHKWAGQLLGYQAEIVWFAPDPMVVMEGQFIERDDYIISLLSPFVVLNLLLLFLIAFAPSTVATFVVSTAFLLNAAASAGDLYNAAFLLRQPKGTLSYVPKESEFRSYIYHPQNGT